MSLIEFLVILFAFLFGILISMMIWLWRSDVTDSDRRILKALDDAVKREKDRAQSQDQTPPRDW